VFALYVLSMVGVMILHPHHWEWNVVAMHDLFMVRLVHEIDLKIRMTIHIL
jgi:hypothetical protein